MSISDGATRFSYLVQKKRSKYFAVIGYYENGKRKYKWCQLQTSIEQPIDIAREEMNARLDELVSDILVPDVFVKYAERWILYKKSYIEPTTWEIYNLVINTHIVPYFKKMNLKVCEIKPKHIKEYYDYLYTNGRKDGRGKGLSTSSIAKHRIILNGIFNEAIMDELIEHNPASNVKLPGKYSTQTKSTFLDLNQAKKLLSLFEGDRIYGLVCTTLYYGLRRSEVLGLKWSDVDFEKNTITINHSVVKAITVHEKDSVKTSSSNASFVLLDNVKKVLYLEKEKQQKYQQLFGDGYIKTDYVFTWEDGKPFLPDYITKTFEKTLINNGFPKMRFHDLRHSTASILYDEGWSMKDIQLWLRHSCIDVTADIYTHISNNRKRMITQGMELLFTS